MPVRLMDMGDRRYGDCSTVVIDGTRILIDGGHRGDERDVADGGTGLLSRIRDAFAADGLVHVELLVVTHAHSDHVGCLPELVDDGRLTADWVLAVDEVLSFPGTETPDGAVKRVAAAMREEPIPASAPFPEVSTAIDDAACLAERYGAMLSRLAADGSRVVRLGRDPTLPLERAFERIDLKVLGPDVGQLLLCAAAVERARDVALARAARAAARDATGGEVAMYRTLVGPGMDAAGAADGGGSAAVNCQSAILALGTAPRMLFLGDMQFADPQVAGIRPHVASLLRRIRAVGPYDFVRLPHHGAPNGSDASLLEAVGGGAALGISGGRCGGHPSPEVLDLLASTEGAQWARTDLNGEVLWDAAARQRWTVARGGLNDASAPAGAVGPAVPPSGGGRRGGAGAARSRAAPLVAGASEAPPSAAGGARRLLFVTSTPLLEDRIGDDAGRAVDLIRGAGHRLLDVRDRGLAAAHTREAAVGFDGVVLIGGHEVVPALVVDALPAAIRSVLSRSEGDPDSHVVWSDDPYVSAEDGAPAMPISRIPDGGSGALVLSALAGGGGARRVASFGLRNAERPFAESAFGPVSGGRRMDVSAPAVTGLYGSRVEGSTYLMLHGSTTTGGATGARTRARTPSLLPTSRAGTTGWSSSAAATGV